MAVPLSVTMEKIRKAARRETVDELVNSFHREQFSLAVLKGLVKWIRDFDVILEEVINEYNDVLIVPLQWKC